MGEKAEVLAEGCDVSIFTTAAKANEAVSAAKILSEQGINAEVLKFKTTKPIDQETLLNSAKNSQAIVTAEDNNDLWIAVAEILGESFPVPIIKASISPNKIVEAAHKALVKKAEEPKMFVHKCSAEMILKKTNEFHSFKYDKGQQMNSLQDLADALENMKDEVFNHHVTEERNDFSEWVGLVLKDVWLAIHLLHHNTKEGMRDSITRRIKYLESRIS